METLNFNFYDIILLYVNVVEADQSQKINIAKDKHSLPIEKKQIRTLLILSQKTHVL